MSTTTQIKIKKTNRPDTKNQQAYHGGETPVSQPQTVETTRTDN